MTIPQIKIKAGREQSIRRFHLWVFSGALVESKPDIEPGSVVQVVTHHGEHLATAHYEAGSIALKILSFDKEVIDQAFFEKRLEQAIYLRANLGLGRDFDTTAFRLVHAEGDLLPGLIIDLYDNTAVMQCHSQGMYLQRKIIAQALRNTLGPGLKAIFLKHVNQSDSAEASASAAAGEYLYGQKVTAYVFENRLQFTVDWEQGQKTGFFLDQRENRLIIRKLANEKVVLNAFAYTGGFSVAAGVGGANAVTSVDASQTALTQCEQHMRTNCSGVPHQALREDCFKYFANLREKFDLIILDPPAFVKHRAALKRGINGYEELNAQALKVLPRGGLLATFSCSQLVTNLDFFQLIQRAALRVKAKVRIVHELSQAPCHPKLLSHPEGNYLKGFLLEVIE
ncbi:class I SAM-dependent rRNA methyltransferase [bacterium]|nr:class I SAM-dependent rRNA methyltransferase [bacterium]